MWSPLGPVLLDGVGPFLRVQSKSSFVPCTKLHIDDSKSQLKGGGGGAAVVGGGAVVVGKGAAVVEGGGDPDRNGISE